MQHTYIITAADLSRYADTRESQGTIPELLYHLIRQSVPNARSCRIPYGDAVNQPGRDGVVECDEGYFQFVPAGSSCWEIGTGANPRTKASEDFLKRTKQLSDVDRGHSSFVFVTPRSTGTSGWEESEQAAWIERRQNRGWDQIRIIDGVKLADWLREFPALGRWMATKAGITRSLGGITTPLEHWDLVLSQGDTADPPLPPKLFTTARSAACDALKAVFSGSSQRLFLFAESETDVEDFVSAYLYTLDADTAQEYANHCLFISDEDAWRTISELRKSHILVASPRLGLDLERQSLQAVATRKGHRVIIPLYGAQPGGSPDIIALRSPSQSQIETILREARFPDVRSRELASIGGGRLSALRRHLLGLGSLPPYVGWSTARELARAVLIGEWDAKNPVDIQAMQGLLGRDYGEWIEEVRADALRSDSPLLQTNEKWRLVARGEVWNALGNRITDDDLDHLRAIAISVLGERDPQFDLPKEERYAAALHGKKLEHSSLIRKGLAETLALLGSRPRALSQCSLGKAESTATLVVRELLDKATWERWASLDSHMPLLAEAAPDEFLTAIETALVDLPSAPFHEIFAQEGGGGFGGRTYLCGLLWALESLAWSSDYLPRVSIALADLASIDPGGSWQNRPAASLADIYLPWHVQTTAPFEKRQTALEAVLKEQPEVGWSLLLALLPRSHASTTGSHKPVWREFLPRDWEEGVLQTEYWEQVTAFTELALELATNDVEKLVALTDRLPDLPRPAHQALLGHLSSEAVTGLAEARRHPIWEKLNRIVLHHRRFSDAAWALPEEAVKEIERTKNLLGSLSPQFKHRGLFNDRDFDLLEEKGNYEEQRERLSKARQDAANEIMSQGGLPSCLDFVSNVASPWKFGLALGSVAPDEIEAGILPALLDSEDPSEAKLVAGFSWARFCNRRTEWVDTVLSRDWTNKHKAKLLTLLPFENEIWDRVASCLNKPNQEFYWRNAQVNPYGPDRDLSVAIDNLLTYNREGAAVMCIAGSASDKSELDEALATTALIAVIESEGGIAELDRHRTVELIKRLQTSEAADQDAMLRIEWNFLPWLDRFSSGSPATLEKGLAKDPAFFADVVGLVFRSRHKTQEDSTEPDERKQNLARNAYRLLNDWRRCPGLRDDGTLDPGAFKEWINEARRITEETGHAEVAQSQIGLVLIHAPSDPDGLWIHEAVAAVLNNRDTSEMRSGFATGLLNQRGIHAYTQGKEERELAAKNREKAESLDARGFTRFGTALREVAKSYDRQADHEEKRDPLED